MVAGSFDSCRVAWTLQAMGRLTDMDVFVAVPICPIGAVHLPRVPLMGVV